MALQENNLENLTTIGSNPILLGGAWREYTKGPRCRVEGIAHFFRTDKERLDQNSSGFFSSLFFLGLTKKYTNFVSTFSWHTLHITLSTNRKMEGLLMFNAMLLISSILISFSLYAQEPNDYQSACYRIAAMDAKTLLDEGALSAACAKINNIYQLECVALAKQTFAAGSLPLIVESCLTINSDRAVKCVYEDIDRNSYFMFPGSLRNMIRGCGRGN